MKGQSGMHASITSRLYTRDIAVVVAANLPLCVYKMLCDCSASPACMIK